MRRIPILLIETSILLMDVSNYIKSDGVNKSYVMGATVVVSDNVVSELANTGRLARSNRYITNVNVFSRFSVELKN